VAQQIIHVRLAVGDGILMGSDAPPDRYREPQGFSVSISVKDPAEADRIFNALAEKGKANADPENFLGDPLRRGGRTIRHSMDDQLRANGLTLLK
jgi:uncharacterized glyoxalase superfamily protein PhnB